MNLEFTIRECVRDKKGLLFEIRPHSGNIGVDIGLCSAFHKFEILIPAYPTVCVDGVVDFHVQDVRPTSEQNMIVPLVQLSYAFSWLDLSLDS